MNRTLGNILFIILVFFIGGEHKGFAQDREFPAFDTWENRAFDTLRLHSYKNKSDFIYEKAKYNESEFSKWWRRIKYNFFNLIEKGFSSNVFKIVITAVLISFLLWLFMKNQATQFIAKDNTSNRKFVEELDIRIEEDILKSKLESAKSEKKWRDAIRYSYLIILKSLHEESLIQWEEWKLSADYEAELTEQNLRQDFGFLTKYFNYSWYGDGLLDEDKFAHFEQTYQDLYTKIKQLKV